MRKQKIKPYKKILCIERGSVYPWVLETLRATNPEIFMIIYRQGSVPPKLVDIRSMRNEKTKNKPYKKILYIESGSVEPWFLEPLRTTNPEIFMIIYSQGSVPPELFDIRSMRNEKHIY